MGGTQRTDPWDRSTGSGLRSSATTTRSTSSISTAFLSASVTYIVLNQMRADRTIVHLASPLRSSLRPAGKRCDTEDSASTPLRFARCCRRCRRCRRRCPCRCRRRRQSALVCFPLVAVVKSGLVVNEEQTGVEGLRGVAPSCRCRCGCGTCPVQVRGPSDATRRK